MEVPPAAEEDTDALKLLKFIWGYASRKLSMDEIYKLLVDPPTDHVNDVREQYSRILFVAAEMGNTRFIVELLRTFPELLTKLDKEGHTIFISYSCYASSSRYLQPVICDRFNEAQCMHRSRHDGQQYASFSWEIFKEGNN